MGNAYVLKRIHLNLTRAHLQMPKPRRKTSKCFWGCLETHTKMEHLPSLKDLTTFFRSVFIIPPCTAATFHPLHCIRYSSKGEEHTKNTKAVQIYRENGSAWITTQRNTDIQPGKELWLMPEDSMFNRAKQTSLPLNSAILHESIGITLQVMYLCRSRLSTWRASSL